ncbi:ankyrin repeat domain-containing protein [Wolbachia endosymbiont of Rhagoletis cingulata]|uniref:ankyrin repeat domain-containing protein n=1 Tax=Wolbachia endosymbiont of Rhagoletis cingulata TaxID=1220542 RepID=UPI003AF4087C
MTLDIKKWKTILNVTDNTDILEHIKAKLKEQDESVYQEWEQSNFNLSYLFSVSIGDKVNGVTLLHIAARCGHLNVVEHLIEKGAKINGSTPLHMAVLKPNSELNEVDTQQKVSQQRN